MANYHVVGIKKYSGEIQSTLSKIIMDEQKAIINGLKKYSREEQIELFATDGLKDIGKKELNQKHGEHSHYFLLNDNAMNAMREYNIPLNVLEELEMTDPINQGYALLIRNVRFV